VNPRAEYCESLSQHLTQQLSAAMQSAGLNGQVPLGSVESHDPTLPMHLLDANCKFNADSLAPETLSTNPDHSMTQALLRFMIDATPETSLAQDIKDNFARYREKMSTAPAAQLLGTGANFFNVENVPGAVSPVKARLAYVQVPKGEETVLSLVWKVSRRVFSCTEYQY
jgi:extracellular elastinolytic metalloproteinase